MQQLPLDERVILTEEALRAYRTALKQTPGFAKSDCPRRVLDAVLSQLDASLRQPFLLVGLAYTCYADRPNVVREVFSETFTSADAVEWGIASYVFFVDNKDPHLTEGYMRSELTKSMDNRIWTEILQRVLFESPDDSRAYVSAALTLLDEARSAVAIREFRAAWSRLAPERREAIAICDQARMWNFARSREGPVFLYGMQSKLQTVVASTDFPVSSIYRKRWVDTIFPGLRPVLWEALSAACSRFSVDLPKLGGEREQVGALLAGMMGELRGKTKLVEDSLRRSNNLHGELGVDHYILSTSEENRWGADFALVIRFREDDGVFVSRYVLFQAKRIKDGSIRVPHDQLRTLLSTCWHSSFYIAWRPNLEPHCIPANLLRSYERFDRSVAGGTATPSLAWADMVAYCDSFPDLLVDRFFTCELGDPLTDRPDTPSRGIAEHLAVTFGCDEIVLFSFSYGRPREGPRVQVVPEPQVIRID